MTSRTAPGLREIREAQARLDGVARVTPIYRSETFTRLVGREVFLKAENLQRTGSFKVRGAYNRLSLCTEAERSAGVVTASAGNHGQAVAWAAREVGAVATIYMPEDAPMAKLDATRSYGARVELVPGQLEEALAAARVHVEETGATFVHPFEDLRVIAGQGTIGLELAEQVPDAETVVVPIGGGGLCSGIAAALKALRPAKLVGVQAAGTLPGGSGFTIADGIAVKKPGDLTMAILSELLDEIVVVTDEEISEAIVLLAERAKLVVEGAGAVGIAALLHGRVRGAGGPAAVVLSGGNIDSSLLISVMRRGLAVSGRYLVLRSRVPDRPGELVKLLALLAEQRVNVVEVEHVRESIDVPVGETGVELTLLTRDRAHCDALLETLHESGYAADRLG